jgi:hypothetical protein
MNRPVVDYLIARGGLPAARGRAFDYVLAGDGLFLAASNSDLEVRIPVALCSVRGLAPAYAACTLKHGRLSRCLWDQIVHCLDLAYVAGCELFVGIRYDGAAGYRLSIPPQAVGPVSVAYPPQDDLVLELHSHGDAAAHFSATDTADEQRLRLYAVVGRLGNSRPQMALRAGAYGYFMPLPWTSVFDADPALVDDVFDAPPPTHRIALAQ